MLPECSFIPSKFIGRRNEAGSIPPSPPPPPPRKEPNKKEKSIRILNTQQPNYRCDVATQVNCGAAHWKPRRLENHAHTPSLPRFIPLNQLYTDNSLETMDYFEWEPTL